ncbi:MAG TPA: hypothetical protein VMC02_14385 [Steroidobacteraceae bacterium]|nr:hypothetical protein [Steroidobacteraceae bacterium]
MRLARTGPARERRERRERFRRSRAAAVALRETFPAVQQVRLELFFQGSSATTPAPQCHTLHGPARAFFEFPCPYADCDGEFSLGPAVEAALADPSHRATGEAECSGGRAARDGGKQSCKLRLTYCVTVTYRP